MPKKTLKILNLYAGIGGNRNKWGDDHKITAVELDPEIADIYAKRYHNDIVIVGDAKEYLLNHYSEYDFIWASPKCTTHSRARFCNAGGGKRLDAVYIDMSLYQIILFLTHYFNGKWIVENVIPYYDPLISPNLLLGRHSILANFPIFKIDIKSKIIDKIKLSDFLDIDLSSYSGRKDTLLRNQVDYNLGKHILDCAINDNLIGSPSERHLFESIEEVSHA